MGIYGYAERARLSNIEAIIQAIFYISPSFQKLPIAR